MFLERLNKNGIKGNKFYYDAEYSAFTASNIQMPNCTAYAYGRSGEIANQNIRPSGLSKNNAKNWYVNSSSTWVRSSTPKVGAVACWTGDLGHVAIVERVMDDGSCLVSQSNYTRDSSKMDANFFQLKQYKMEVGKVTSGVGLVFQGYLLNPFVDLNIVERDTSKNQVKVLAEQIRARKAPNGEAYEGLYIPMGLYDVLDTKVDGYTWAKIADDVWFATNDDEKWTETYIASSPVTPETPETPENNEEEDDDGVDGVIDVSYYQSTIDYAKVKAAGIKGVILRCGRTGYGTAKSKQEDSTFQKHYKGFKDVGLPVGAYYYSCATTVAEAKEEAELVKKILNGKQLEYPVYFDTEDNHDITASGNSKTSQYSIGKTKLTKVAKAFLETLEDAGYYVGIYASKSWLENQLDMSQLDDYAVWLAQYASKPTYGGKYGMWQYSSTGKVNGISGNVDMNWCYVDYPSAIKKAGLNGYKATETPSKPQTDEKDEQIAELKKQLTELETELQTANSEVTRLKKKVNDARAILNAS